MHPVVRMRGIVPAIVGSESCELSKTVEYKRFYLHNRVTRRDHDGGEKTALKKQSVSLRDHSASSSSSARRPSSGFDSVGEEADVRANAAVVDGHADVRASAAMTDDNADDAIG